MKRLRLLLFLFTPVLCSLQHLHAQEQLYTVGLQFKPIIPSTFFDAGELEETVGDVRFSLQPKVSFSGGMVVRYLFNKRYSIEGGINYISRNFSLNVNSAGEEISDQANFTIVGYEIPILGLLYVQLGKQVYMNAAFGQSIDMFPSDVATISQFHEHISYRTSWVKLSLLANLGFEYRTEEKGAFYLGASFHRPYRPIFVSTIEYTGINDQQLSNLIRLTGNYLTLDFRYFFHEDPEKNKRRRR